MNIIKKIRTAMMLNNLYNKLQEAWMKNWKTTLAGLAGALVTGLTAYFEAHGVTAKDIGLMAFQVIVGLAAKDFNVTGK